MSCSGNVVFGRIAGAHVKNAVESLSDRATFCFVCGPPGMIADVCKLLEEAGVDDKRVFFEKWW